jgi:hypothetical protein
MARDGPVSDPAWVVQASFGRGLADGIRAFRFDNLPSPFRFHIFGQEAHMFENPYCSWQMPAIAGKEADAGQAQIHCARPFRFRIFLFHPVFAPLTVGCDRKIIGHGNGGV